MAPRIQKPKTTPSTVTVTARVSLDQREALQKAAVDAGTTLSAFIVMTLDAALTGESKAAPPRENALPAPVVTLSAGLALSDPEALEQLRRIGVNINQIAHAANAGLPPDVTLAVQSFNELLAMLKDPEGFAREIQRQRPIVLPVADAKSPMKQPEKVPVLDKAIAPRVNLQPPAQARPELPATKPAEQPHRAPLRGVPIPGHNSTRIPAAPPIADAGPWAPATNVSAAMPPHPQPIQPQPPRLPPMPLPMESDKPRKIATRPPRPDFGLDRFYPTPPGHRPAVQPSSQVSVPNDPPHPQARHELQDGDGLRPPRSEGGDEREGRLGFIAKLWRR